MYRIGIDPGLSGAIAILKDDLTLIDVFDMPVMMLRKGKNQVNAAALWQKLAGNTAKLQPTAYLENVHPMPKEGVSSVFSFGRSMGVIEGVLASLNIPVVLVSPQHWKARAGLKGAEKDMARTLAVRLYPAADLSKKKDIGKADAILIARYGG